MSKADAGNACELGPKTHEEVKEMAKQGRNGHGAELG